MRHHLCHRHGGNGGRLRGELHGLVSQAGAGTVTDAGKKNMAEVRLFREDDRDLGVSTMVRAFANDGLYRYFIPEDGNRGRFLEKFMTFRL